MQLTYDALGRRIAKSFRGLTTHYVWDGDVLLHEWVDGQLEAPDRTRAPAPRSPVVEQREAELSGLLLQEGVERGSAAMPISWLFDGQGGAPLAKLQQQHVAYVLSDFRGNPCALVDGDGRNVWSATLSSYGELRDLRGPRSLCPFRGLGRYEDLETGLYYERDGYYDPESGNLIGPKPIGVTGPMTLAYRRDPLSWLRG